MNEEKYYCPVCKRNHIKGRGSIYEDHLQFKGQKKMPDDKPHYKQILMANLMENQAQIKWDTELTDVVSKIRSLTPNMKQELYLDAINRLYVDGWKVDHRYVNDNGRVVLVFEDATV